MTNGPFEYTKSGNRRHASYSTVANWVRDAWNEVPVTMIQKSFHKCGILSADDSINLHTNLLELITGNPISDNQSEPTGLSDDESN